MINLANRGLMSVRVSFPDRKALTVYGALTMFKLWRYVSIEECEHTIQDWSHYAAR